MPIPLVTLVSAGHSLRLKSSLAVFNSRRILAGATGFPGILGLLPVDSTSEIHTPRRAASSLSERRRVAGSFRGQEKITYSSESIFVEQASRPVQPAFSRAEISQTKKGREAQRQIAGSPGLRR